MHELSIVQSILEIVDQELKKANAEKIERIDLDIGFLSGIEIDALLFAWEACVPDTILANAERKINRIPAVAKCTVCSHEFKTDDYFAQCSNCGDYMTELIKGKELKIKSLVVS